MIISLIKYKILEFKINILNHYNIIFLYFKIIQKIYVSY